MNVFGLWVNWLRVFTTTTALQPDKVVAVILLTFALHNSFWNKSKDKYTGNSVFDIESNDVDFNPGELGGDPENIKFLRAIPSNKRNRALSATHVREVLADHFYSSGKFPGNGSYYFEKVFL